MCAAQKHQHELWERHADLVIRPDVQTLAWDDFHRAEEAIDAGKLAARCALPRIQQLLREDLAAAAEAGFTKPPEYSDRGLHFLTEAMGS